MRTIEVIRRNSDTKVLYMNGEAQALLHSRHEDTMLRVHTTLADRELEIVNFSTKCPSKSPVIFYVTKDELDTAIYNTPVTY